MNLIKTFENLFDLSFSIKVMFFLKYAYVNLCSLFLILSMGHIFMTILFFKYIAEPIKVITTSTLTDINCIHFTICDTMFDAEI